MVAVWTLKLAGLNRHRVQRHANKGCLLCWVNQALLPVYGHAQCLDMSEDPGCCLLCPPKRGGTYKPVIEIRENLYSRQAQCQCQGYPHASCKNAVVQMVQAGLHKRLTLALFKIKNRRPTTESRTVTRPQDASELLADQFHNRNQANKC